MSGAPVDRLANGSISFRDFEQALGVDEEQDVAGALQMRYPGKQLALCFFFEVNHHVPAKDGGQWPLHRQTVHQVELPEGNQRRELGGDLISQAIAAALLDEKT